MNFEQRLKTAFIGGMILIYIGAVSMFYFDGCLEGNIFASMAMATTPFLLIGGVYFVGVWIDKGEQ